MKAKKKKPAKAVAKKKKKISQKEKDLKRMRKLFSSSEDVKRFYIAYFRTSESQKEITKLYGGIVEMRDEFDRLDRRLQLIDLNPAISKQRRSEITEKTDPVIEGFLEAEALSQEYMPIVDKGAEAYLEFFEISLKGKKGDAMSLAAIMEKGLLAASELRPALDKLRITILARLAEVKKEMDKDIN